MVVARACYGYNLTEGKEYEVLEYIPEWLDESVPAGFTWPAYVAFLDDNGKRQEAHASRFKEKA